MGSGTYGKVYAAEDGAAMKKINLTDIDVAIRECIFSVYLQGASVPKVLGVHAGESFVCILMEQCFPVSPSPELLGPLVCAIQSLHARNVLHRDVSPGNVMATRVGKLVLIDFGLSSFMCGRGCRQELSTEVTTIISRAPELMTLDKYKRYGAEIDYFSAGASALFMLGFQTYTNSGKTYETDVLPMILAAAAKCKHETIRRLIARDQTLVCDNHRISVYFQDVKKVIHETHLLLTPLVPQEHAHESHCGTIIKAFSMYFLKETHSDCLERRARLLASAVCDGHCFHISVAAVVISVCLHQRYSSDLEAVLLTYTKLPLVHFRQLVARVLVSACCKTLSWLGHCAHADPINAGNAS